LNDKNVLCVWGIVWDVDVYTMVVGCYVTHLILILHYKHGGGGRIWTFDLRVMSSMFPPILTDTIYRITVLYGRINCYSVIPNYS